VYLVKVVMLSLNKRNRLTRDSIRMISCLKAWGIFTDEDMDNDTDNEDV
jgi:hypothetical protein